MINPAIPINVGERPNIPIANKIRDMKKDKKRRVIEIIL
jgi:hypothetical protein